jgi:hypothetical protein
MHEIKEEKIILIKDQPLDQFFFTNRTLVLFLAVQCVNKAFLGDTSTWARRRGGDKSFDLRYEHSDRVGLGMHCRRLSGFLFGTTVQETTFLPAVANHVQLDWLKLSVDGAGDLFDSFGAPDHVLSSG